MTTVLTSASRHERQNTTPTGQFGEPGLVFGEARRMDQVQPFPATCSPIADVKSPAYLWNSTGVSSA